MKRSPLARKTPLSRSRLRAKADWWDETVEPLRSVQPGAVGCHLAEHGIFERGPTPCDGRLVRAHLIPRRVLKDSVWWLQGGTPSAPTGLWDPRTWVWACGGITGGPGGHHGAFDYARTIRLPRSAIPEATEQFAAEHGFGWYLDRTYGSKE